MFPKKYGARRISIAAAALCLVAGLAAVAAGTASAATAGSASAAHNGTANARAAAGGLTLDNPGTLYSQPGSTTALAIKYSDTVGPGVTQDFSATGLPPGQSISPSTGVISGTTSSTIASYDVTVSDTDSDGNTASVEFTWHVWNKIFVGPFAVPQFYWERAGTAQVGASDSASGKTLAFSASGLPAGMSINSSTGIITGTPTAVGTGKMTVTVTDGTGSAGTGTSAWAVASTVSLGPVPSSWTSAAGQTANLAIDATDTPSEPLTYSTSGLPPGVEADGPDFVGWPSTPGTYTVSHGAYDPYGGADSEQFNWTVTPAADSGPNGPVLLNLDGKCLDDTGNSSANGNKIQMWACNGGAAQKWTYAEDGTLWINGKCLDVIGNGTSAGTGVQIWSCTGAGNQQWVPADSTQLINPVSDFCLTDPGNSSANGTKLQISYCGTGARDDEWTIPAGAVLSAIPGRCLDDSGNSTANGNKIDEYTCNGGAPQKWTLDPDGTIRVNGKCLDDTGDSVTSGTGLQLWSCNGGAAQKWTMAISLGPLGVEFKHGSLCASPTSFTAANGARLILGTCGTDESNWHVW